MSQLWYWLWNWGWQACNYLWWSSTGLSRRVLSCARRAKKKKKRSWYGDKLFFSDNLYFSDSLTYCKCYEYPMAGRHVRLRRPPAEGGTSKVSSLKIVDRAYRILLLIYLITATTCTLVMLTQVWRKSTPNGYHASCQLSLLFSHQYVPSTRINQLYFYGIRKIANLGHKNHSYQKLSRLSSRLHHLH